MSQYVNQETLKVQTRSYAYVYNNRTSVISDQTIVQNPNTFEEMVNEAFDRMSRTAGMRQYE